VKAWAWVPVLLLVAACGGANPGTDGGVWVPPGETGGEVKDVPGGTDTARDTALEDVAATDTAVPDEAPADTAPTDPGTADTGVTDPGTATDPGPKDPGTTTDPGTPYDPGTPSDPGTATDLGPQDAVGGCDPCGMGTVAGKTCAPNVKTAIPFVKIWVDTTDCEGNPHHYQTYSNAAGEYSLQIPCGTQTIWMEKGSFHGAFTRWIDKGLTTTITSSDGCFPGTAAKIAVVTGDWDSIQDTLRLLYLHYTLVDGMGGDEGKGNSTAVKFLSDPAKLAAYDIIFLNCTWAAWPNMQASGAAISAALKTFVANGGSIYASDYALPYISETWPAYILGGGWSAAGNSTYATNVVDTDLGQYLGKTQVSIKYGLGPLTCVSDVDAATHVFLESSKAISGCDGTQMMMSFEPETGGGRVIYTTFHNDEQPTTSSDMQSILEYTVFLM
jgi:hypothetical protein